MGRNPSSDLTSQNGQTFVSLKVPKSPLSPKSLLASCLSAPHLALNISIPCSLITKHHRRWSFFFIQIFHEDLNQTQTSKWWNPAKKKRPQWRLTIPFLPKPWLFHAGNAETPPEIFALRPAPWESSRFSAPPKNHQVRDQPHDDCKDGEKTERVANSNSKCCWQNNFLLFFFRWDYRYWVNGWFG